MSEIAIKVNHLGKRYRIGQREQYNTFRDAIIDTIKAPYRLFRNSDDGSNGSEYFYALKDISFEVPQGEIVGIIGGNGAGKSTLLKILSRITSPTVGSVVLHGRVGSLLEVGTGFHSELTGRENIFLSGSILGMRRREIVDKFDEIVKFAEIEKFLDTPVKRYSSGMYVRLAFAVAAHLDPEILLVDEVLAVGDAAFQKKCLGKMDEVAKGGRTVLFVSHQMDMIRSLCNKCVLLNRGCVETFDESDIAISKYLAFIKSDKKKSSFELGDDKSLIIQILSGRSIDKNGKIKDRFDVFDPIILELNYVVRKPTQGSIIKIEIKRNNQPLFWSFDSDLKPEVLDLRDSGMYISRIELPCPLLKPGRYSVSVGTGIANSQSIQDISDCFLFDVELLSKPSTFMSYAEKRPGMIALPLNWKSKKFNDV